MNMQPINPPLRDGQQVTCDKCGKPIIGGKHVGMADLDGEAFKAFYHSGCAVSVLYVHKLKGGE